MALKSLPWGDSVCLLPSGCEPISQHSETEWEEGAGEFSVHYADFISDSDFRPPQLCSPLWLVPRPEPCGPAVQIFLLSLRVSQFFLKGVGTRGSTHLPVFSSLLWVLPLSPPLSSAFQRVSSFLISVEGTNFSPASPFQTLSYGLLWSAKPFILPPLSISVDCDLGW